MRATLAAIGLAALLAAGPAAAELTWWSQAPARGGEPAVRSVHAGHGSGGSHGHHGGRRSSPLYLHGADGRESVELWRPTLEREPVESSGGQVTVRSTGMDNYHLLIAKRSGDRLEEVALRYLPLRGRPSGHSPSELLDAYKARLELIPDPLPREHRRYLSGSEAVFRVVFERVPLPGAEVILTTSNGSRLHGRSDESGRVVFLLPEDFAEVRPGRENNRPAELALAVAHNNGGVHYATTLSHQYYVNPAHWQSAAGGWLAGAVGFAAGLVLLRHGRARG